MANDSAIRPGGSPVPSVKLQSGAKVKTPEAPKPAPQQAVDSVVSEVGRARDSVEKISDRSSAADEVAAANREAAQNEIRDVEIAARRAKQFESNAGSDPVAALNAHKLDTERALELLK